MNRGADIAMLAGIGALAGVAGTLWLWGGLAGALFGSGWPAMRARAAARVLIRLPSHLSDPGRRVAGAPSARASPARPASTPH